MSVFKVTDSIWYIEDALPDQLLQRFLGYVRSIQEVMELARVYEIGSCNVSFWYPFARGPSHIIENVVETLRRHADPSPSCIGAEWWFNIRPSSKGMQSHFDKDESLRKRTGEMRSPDRSSV